MYNLRKFGFTLDSFHTHIPRIIIETMKTAIISTAANCKCVSVVARLKMMSADRIIAKNKLYP